MEGPFFLIQYSHELLLLPILLYAETHYRFKYFWSFLRKREPEILADAPHRIDPGHHLPVMILIKDAQQYPIVLDQVRATLFQGAAIKEIILMDKPTPVSEKYWWKIFEIDIEDFKGWIKCDVEIHYTVNGKKKSCRNDNYRTSSKSPLNVYSAYEPLPTLPNLFFGDIHTHSSYTDDQVEYGAPMEASVHLSRSMGLSFFASTDHSYDMDDSIDNYLINDPSLPKWIAYQSEVDSLNKSISDFVVLRGEEVSCRNIAGKNVHLLLLGNRNFLAGSGDSGEKWLHPQSEMSIVEVLSQKETQALAFAAHPREGIPFLQRHLILRGRWESTDIETEGLNGIQFANGIRGSGFSEGYRAWISRLLKGEGFIAVAGNDAHGNFNRFRQLKLPFILVREKNYQLFGMMRTGVFITGEISEESILENILTGKCIITDGPVCQIAIQSISKKNDVDEVHSGKSEISLSIDAVSSRDYGKLDQLKVFKGVVGDGEELIEEASAIGTYEFHCGIKLSVQKDCYFRAEIYTSKDNPFRNISHFCFSNPLWIHP